MRGQWDKISFPLTILETQRANDIQITLSMTHSGQIDIANLWVSLGQKALATIQLQPNGAPQQVVISLTPELLARFGNILTIAVRHQLPNSLSLSEQRVEAAEAVTELLAEHSFFELSYTPTDAAPTLATAEALMRSGQMYNHAIQLVSLLPDTAPSDLTLAGMLVQAGLCAVGVTVISTVFTAPNAHRQRQPQSDSTDLWFARCAPPTYKLAG
ncbi:hypothetical protein JCM19237_2306 [Photobacterium aphoticum]|uniref:Uncharacterized protein n=1 Tax=Photobacterium aphoticum TaxID=754436 RepID=A0A090QLZ1_9GAMM|nr:hypothetical protein JCM19237_2306 [Photobacterium aphoticum]